MEHILNSTEVTKKKNLLIKGIVILIISLFMIIFPFSLWSWGYDSSPALSSLRYPFVISFLVFLGFAVLGLHLVFLREKSLFKINYKFIIMFIVITLVFYIYFVNYEAYMVGCSTLFIEYVREEVKTDISFLWEGESPYFLNRVTYNESLSSNDRLFCRSRGKGQFNLDTEEIIKRGLRDTNYPLTSSSIMRLFSI